MTNLYGIVIIARDEESNIRDCINSIMQTDNVPICVVVDERSNDMTENIAREYTPNVIVAAGNRGRLRNIGYKYLDLPYVLYVDADMRISQSYMKTLFNVLSSDPELAFVGGAQKAIETCFLGKLECEYWNYRKAIPAGGAMYRTNVLDVVGGFNDELNVGEDGELQRRIVKLGWKSKWVDDVCIDHKYAPSNKVWFRKMTYGFAAGISKRGALRLCISPFIGIHAALKRRNINMLWYIPLRSIVLLLGPGRKKEYKPVTI